MTKISETVNTISNNETTQSCPTLLGIFQIVIGVLLVTASAYGYSLLQHPAVLIPTLMGAALLFNGTKVFMVCREHSPNNTSHVTG